MTPQDEAVLDKLVSEMDAFPLYERIAYIAVDMKATREEFASRLTQCDAFSMSAEQKEMALKAFDWYSKRSPSSRLPLVARELRESVNLRTLAQ